jgi:hypothetical protein
VRLEESGIRVAARDGLAGRDRARSAIQLTLRRGRVSAGPVRIAFFAAVNPTAKLPIVGTVHMTFVTVERSPLEREGGLESPPRRPSYINRKDLGLGAGYEPMRRIKAKQRHVSLPGYFPTRKTFDRRPIRTESILEQAGLGHIETNARYLKIAPQPHRLTYYKPCSDGSWMKATYVPDLVVLTAESNVVVVDFKWSYLRALPEWLAVEPIIGDAYRVDHGAAFTVLTEEHVLIEPRRTNIAIMCMHRPPAENDGALTLVRAAISQLGLPTTIGTVRAKAGLGASHDRDPSFSAIMELASAGEITLDMSTLFHDGTEVRAGVLS